MSTKITKIERKEERYIYIHSAFIRLSFSKKSSINIEEIHSYIINERGITNITTKEIEDCMEMVFKYGVAGELTSAGKPTAYQACGESYFVAI